MKKLVQLIAFLTFSVSIESCSLSSQILEYTSEAQGAIPPNFGQDTTAVLLCVLENRKSYDRYLIKHVKKQYHGKYEFIQANQVNQVPYNNLMKYRYLFGVTQNSGSARIFDPSSKRYTTVYSFSYYHYVLDRRRKKKYNITSASSSFGLQIKSYMINLETKRSSYLPSTRTELNEEKPRNDE